MIRIYSYANFSADPLGATVEERPYASRRSAERYGRSHGLTVIDSRAIGEQYPHRNDTQGWDDLRKRRGCLSHH